jgi:hypothetical protein
MYCSVDSTDNRYFGCRNDDGSFNPQKFKENASRPTVKMIEIKITHAPTFKNIFETENLFVRQNFDGKFYV